MIGTETFQDIFNGILVVTVIIGVLHLVWRSTYVHDQPIIATAVVVFQQNTQQLGSDSADSSNRPMASLSHTDVGSPGERVHFELSSAARDLESSETLAADQCCSISCATEQEQNQISEESKVVSEGGSHILKPEDGGLIEEKRKQSSIVEQGLLGKRTSAQSADSRAQEDDETNNTKIATDVHLLQPEFACQKREEEKQSFATDQECILRKRILVQSGDDVAEGGNKINKTEVAAKAVKSESKSDEDNKPMGSIRIRLKFIDDTQRTVHSKLTDEVGTFKRTHFGDNLTIRLIFNGKLLNRDSCTLEQYGLFDDCVVHCHVSQPQNRPSRSETQAAHTEEGGLDMSELLNPLLIGVLVVLWYIRYAHSQLFNTTATLILVILTAIYLVSQYAFTITFNISFGVDADSRSNPGVSPRMENGETASRQSTGDDVIENLGGEEHTVQSSSLQVAVSQTSSDVNELVCSSSQDTITDVQPLQDNIGNVCASSLEREISDSQDSA